MIVSSFTPSYSLLAYLFQFLGTVLFFCNNNIKKIFLYFLQYIYFFSSTFYTKMLSLVKKIHSSFKPLGTINLEAVT
jgi:hypothetical protein